MHSKNRKKYVPPQVMDVSEKILNVYAAQTITPAAASRQIFTALWAETVERTPVLPPAAVEAAVSRRP